MTFFSYGNYAIPRVNTLCGVCVCVCVSTFFITAFLHDFWARCVVTTVRVDLSPSKSPFKSPCTKLTTKSSQNVHTKSISKSRKVSTFCLDNVAQLFISTFRLDLSARGSVSTFRHDLSSRPFVRHSTTYVMAKHRKIFVVDRLLL